MSSMVDLESNYSPLPEGVVKINYKDGDFKPKMTSGEQNYYYIKDGYTNWLDTSAGITRVKLDAVEAIIIEDRTEIDDPYTVSIHTSSSCYTVRFKHAQDAVHWGVWFSNTVASHQSN